MAVGALALILTLTELPDAVEIPLAGAVAGIFLVRLIGMASERRTERPGRAERRDALRKRRRDEIDDAVLAERKPWLYEENRIEELRDELAAYGSSIKERVPQISQRRYANVALTDLKGQRLVVAKPGDLVLIEVDIGPLRKDSDVLPLTRRPFPDDLLPKEHLEMGVLLSSAEMEVGPWDSHAQGLHGHAVEQRLILPGGEASTAGSETLRFALKLPPDFWRSRARLSYLYRDTVVQSQRLDLVAVQPPGEQGECRVMLFATTDFTLSESFADDLEEIAPRRRVSVVANSNSGQVHEITVRSPSSEDGKHALVAFQVDEEGVARVAARMRRQLHNRAPRRRSRKTRDLRNDLRKLAPVGWELFGQIERGARQLVNGANTDAVVQVTMLHESDFSLPWNFVYDIFIDSEANPSKIDLCPVVERLGSDLTIDANTRRCPCEGMVSHRENLLCPFGFWGYRYSFELLMSGKRPKSRIVLGREGKIVIAKTEKNVNKRRLKGHVATLSEYFQQHQPALDLSEASTKAEVRNELSADLPFVYFICHGFKDKLGATRLGIGKGEAIRPTDIDGWVETVFRESEHQLWTEPQPLIFINACASLAIDPKDLAGYLKAFISTAQAVGVIGTEARVSQPLAMEVGEVFFDQLLASGATVDSALREIKASLLNERNLTGLYYTPYCFADLRVAAG